MNDEANVAEGPLHFSITRRSDFPGDAAEDNEAAANARRTSRTNSEGQRADFNLEDPNLVTWYSSSDSANPRNWPKFAKWSVTLLVSAFTFLAPVSSAILAPGVEPMIKQLGIPKSMAQLTMCVFVLAYAIGPLAAGPLSEIYGRCWTLQLWNLSYLVFNTACIFAPNIQVLIMFRFLAGLGGSASFAIGGGIISDVWAAEERGTAVAVYAFLPSIGSALGGMCGGYLADQLGWRYCFIATSSADAVFVALSLCFLRETYPPTILRRRTKKLRSETGNLALYNAHEKAIRSPIRHVTRAMIRPLCLLAREPMIQLLSLHMGVLNGCMYFVIASFPRLWQQVYAEPNRLGILNFISIGVGSFLGSQIAALFQDELYRRLSSHYATGGKPEYRIPLMLSAAVTSPAGLLLYGWPAAERWHWILPDLGALLFSAGVSVGFQAIHVYTVDTYPRYAASAVGAVLVLRSVGGFVVPFFGPFLLDSFGFGKGASVLVVGLLLVGVLGSLVLWAWGEKMRKRSRLAGEVEFDKS